MSIQSKLYVDEKTFGILRSSFSYHQNCDANNRPHGKIFGDLFDIVLESTRDNLFTEWGIHPTMMKNVKIVQSPIRMGGKSRTFELIDTVCTYDENSFNATDNEPMKNFITLSPAILKLDGVLLHEKFWKVTDFSAQNVAPTVIDKIEPIFIGYHFENIDVTEIKQNQIKVDDEVYLIVETENSVGESITIDLNDSILGYEHNGKRLENDILKNVNVNSDSVKVKLKAIKQEK